MAFWHCAGCRQRLKLTRLLRGRRLCEACTRRQEKLEVGRRRAEATVVDALQTAHEQSLQTGAVPHKPVTPKVHFECSCGKKLRAVSKLRGRRVTCPQCGRKITVPLEV